MLEEIEEYYYELIKLEYRRGNWDNCHTKEGLAINAPEEITWETAYLDGDFIKGTKNNNQNEV